MDPLLDVGTDGGMALPIPEKVRTAGMRGVVWLRFRVWLENIGTVGGAAESKSSSSSSSSMAFSGTGAGLLAKGRIVLGYCRERPLLTLIESRIGFLRATDGVGEAVSARGIEGKVASSSAPIDEWLRKDRAVSQT